MDTVTLITDITKQWESTDKDEFIAELLVLLGNDKQSQILDALNNHLNILNVVK